MASFAKFAILAFVAVAVNGLPTPAEDTPVKVPEAEPDAELVKVQNGKIAPANAQEDDETLKTANSYGFGYGYPHYAGYSPYYGAAGYGGGYPLAGYGYGYPYYGYNHFYGAGAYPYGFHGFYG